MNPDVSHLNLAGNAEASARSPASRLIHMTSKPRDISKLFNDKELVKKYDQITVTANVAEEALEIYLSGGGSVEGKTILDNACGTGVVTKAILARTKDVNIEAADISEAMIAVVKPIAENAHPAKVHAHVMDAHVHSPRCNIVSLLTERIESIFS